jgi:hypothetical protein
MEEIYKETVKAVRDGLKAALDRVCGPEFRQMDTAAVLISEVSVAVHELNSLLCTKVVKEPDFEPGNPF